MHLHVVPYLGLPRHTQAPDVLGVDFERYRSASDPYMKFSYYADMPHVFNSITWIEAGFDSLTGSETSYTPGLLGYGWSDLRCTSDMGYIRGADFEGISLTGAYSYTAGDMGYGFTDVRGTTPTILES